MPLPPGGVKPARAAGRPGRSASVRHGHHAFQSADGGRLPELRSGLSRRHASARCRNRSVDRVRRPVARRLALGLLLAVGLTPPAAHAEDSPPLPNTSRYWLLAEPSSSVRAAMLVSCDHRRVGPDRTSVTFCASPCPRTRATACSTSPAIRSSTTASAPRFVARETSRIEDPTEPGEYVHMPRSRPAPSSRAGPYCSPSPSSRDLPPRSGSRACASTTTSTTSRRRR